MTSLVELWAGRSVLPERFVLSSVLLAAPGVPALVPKAGHSPSPSPSSSNPLARILVVVRVWQAGLPVLWASSWGKEELERMCLLDCGCR